MLTFAYTNHLSYFRFWCHVVRDSGLHHFLDTYLRFAPRSFDAFLPTPELQAAEKTIHRQVFMVFLRMSTNKESATAFMKQETFAELIYENWVFDMTKFLDLCALYAESNAPLLTKMISNVFKLQPKYNNDLSDSVASISSVMEARVHQGARGGINAQEGKGSKAGRGLLSSALATAATASSIQTLDERGESTRLQLGHFVLDAGLTLRAFFSIYAPAIAVFAEHGFLFSMAKFYDAIAPILDSSSARPADDKLTRRGLYALLQVSHFLMEYTLNTLSDSASAARFLAIMSELLDQHVFLSDYCGCFPLTPQLHTIVERFPTVDILQLEHIENAIITLDGVALGIESNAKVYLYVYKYIVCSIIFLKKLNEFKY